jgi:hypothetical protein
MKKKTREAVEARSTQINQPTEDVSTDTGVTMLLDHPMMIET